MPLLSFNDLAIGYDNKVILSDLSFDVSKGDYLVILGENGAGKSTFLKTMLGLLKPIKGTISLDAEVKRSEIGYLPQQNVVQKDFPASVWEVVLSGCLARNGLKPFYSKKDKELARALCASDKILVLDEPVTGLDPKVTAQLYQIIDDLNKEGMTIIMISHDLRALEHSNKVLHLDQKVFFGDKESYLLSSHYQAFLNKGGRHHA